jgi:hypothetical protein
MKCEVEFQEENLKQKTARFLKIEEKEITSFQILRKSPKSKSSKIVCCAESGSKPPASMTEARMIDFMACLVSYELVNFKSG